jgi:putative addiction module component (TIGR02574 family)
VKYSREAWSRLSVPERIRLVEEIWDSIAHDADALPITDAQREELDQRLNEYTANPSATEPWAHVREELERDV